MLIKVFRLDAIKSHVKMDAFAPFFLILGTDDEEQ
jgi:hypothetical protein